MNKTRVKLVLIALIAFLVVIQIFQPRRSNPRVAPSKSLKAHISIPDDVLAALVHSCGDCHTNQTRWPWYSHIAPLSWVITDDVNQGRRHMNLDDWEAQPDAKQANDRLVDVCTEIKKNGMPPFSYQLLHRDLRLKPQEIAAICRWSLGFQTSSLQPTAKP